MKIIIAGSRQITDRSVVDQAMRDCGWALEVTEIVSGGAPGVDYLGECWAHDNHVALRRFPADWKKYGKHVAGRLRNAEMARYANALVAIWDGESQGTSHMIDVARLHNLKVFVVECVKDE